MWLSARNLKRAGGGAGRNSGFPRRDSIVWKHRYAIQLMIRHTLQLESESGGCSTVRRSVPGVVEHI
mgnify:CR=1 FL=1